jgi:tetratricopeptide (TPR) repeat protein
MKKSFIITILCVTVMANSAFADINMAKNYLAANNYVAAINEASNLLMQDKSNKEAYRVILRALKLSKRNKEYLDYFISYLKIEPNIDFNLVYDASVMAFLSRDYKRTIILTQRAHFLKPQDPETLNLMGVSYYYLKSYKPSIAALRFTIKYSKDPNHYANLARSYVKDNQIGKAIEVYQKALDIMPHFRRALVELNRLRHPKPTVRTQVAPAPLNNNVSGQNRGATGSTMSQNRNGIVAPTQEVKPQIKPVEIVPQSAPSANPSTTSQTPPSRMAR